MFHQQCADSLCPFATAAVIVLGRESRQLSLLDTQTGAVLDTSCRLPFSVFGTCVDEASGWLAAAGNERTTDRFNVALLRLQRTETERSFRLDAEATRAFGVGRISRGSRNQANSVRFGCSRQQVAPPATATTVRVLLVGSQDKYVYVFALPAAGCEQQNMRPLVQHRFETAINCAAASPDGRWLAATGDTEAVYVRGSEAGFLDKATCAEITLPFTRGQRLLHEQAGSQYCVWSADGQRLAASSDTLHAVAVWAVPPPGAPLEFVQLARFAEFARPALALTFLPPSAGGAHLLAWSELDSNVYVADVDFAGANDAWNRPVRDSCGEREMRARGVQRLRLPSHAAPPELLLAPAAYLNRITGLCCAGDALFVAQTARITKFPILAGWCKELHAHFPVAFRRAVRTLLLGAAQSTPTDEAAPALPILFCLPKEVLVHIISLAAVPSTCWLPARLSREEEDVRFFERREMRDRMPLSDSDEDDGDSEMLNADAPDEDEE